MTWPPTVGTGRNGSDRYTSGGSSPGGSTDNVPSRGGYLLGYEVTRRVLAAMPLEQMVRLAPAQLREHAEEQLSEIAGRQILVFATSK